MEQIKNRREKMDFGMNLFNWFLTNAQPLVLLAIVLIGVYLAYKREVTKLIAFIVIAIIAVGFVYNTTGTKDVMLNFYNRVVTSGTVVGLGA